MKLVDPTGWGRRQYLDFYREAWGCPCIPIRKTKRPDVTWAEYQNKLPTEQDIDTWFFKEGGAWGLAIVCGAVCGNLFSLDLDTDEVFLTLKRAGAFPPGTCIFKSARGYHAIMRADIIPFPVKEHNLPGLFYEFGVSGDRQLSNMPDTPGRYWLEGYLCDDPVTVDYEAWLAKYVDYERKGDLGAGRGDELLLRCIFHKDKTASLSINRDKRCFQCFGCPAKGTVMDLLTAYSQRGLKPPKELLDWVAVNLDRIPAVGWNTGELDQRPIPLIEGLLESGENAKVIISGPTGVGKTTLGLSIGVPVSQGTPALGKLKVPRRLHVAYTNFEQRGDSIISYIRKMTLIFGEPDPEWFKRIDGFDLLLSDKSIHEPLLETLLVSCTELWILDSVYECVKNINDWDEAWDVVGFLKRVVDAGIGVIVLHHTTKAVDEGPKGVEKALGVLGGQIVKWAGTKLIYHSIPEVDLHARLTGNTREWGTVDYVLSYERYTRAALIVEPDDLWGNIPGGITIKTERAVEAQHILELAKRLGITRTELATIFDVTERTVIRWATGATAPDEVAHTKLLEFRDKLQKSDTDLTVACQSPVDPCHPSSDSEAKTAPKTKKVVSKKKGTRTHAPLQPTVNKLHNYTNCHVETEPSCDKCPLKGQPNVPSSIVPGGIALIGEAPGDVEVAKEENFRGPAGMWLDKFLQSAAIIRRECSIINLCTCHPPKNKLPIKAIRCCLPRLLKELEEAKPSMIILLGEKPQEALLPKFPVSRFHGKKIEQDGVLYVVMYHPAALLHNPGLSDTMQLDWECLDDVPICEHIEGRYYLREDAMTMLLAEAPVAHPQGLVSVDTETVDGKLFLGSLTTKPGVAAAFTAPVLVAWLALKEVDHLLMFNAKFDLQVLEEFGLDWSMKEVDDPELLAYCMGYSDLHLKVLEVQELDVWHEPYNEIVPKGKTMADISWEDGARYCCWDTDSGLRLWDFLWDQADERERNLYETIEKPLLPVIVRMEQKGIAVDQKAAQEWAADLTKQNKRLVRELEGMGFDVVTLASPKKLGEALHGMGIKLPKTGKSGQYATDKETLAARKDQHPCIPPLLEKSHVDKLESTYVKPILALPAGARMHTSFNQTRVITGRLSSSNPNLQNLPFEKVARRPYVASPGCKFVGLDFSQVDMRVLAGMSGDPELMGVYQRNEDIHAWMSDELFGNHEGRNRHIIKRASYCIIYLGGAKTLYAAFLAPGGMPVEAFGDPPDLEDCERIIAGYYDRFRDIKAWQDEQIAFAKKHGYIDDYYGRRRHFPQLFSKDRRVVSRAQCEVVNFPIAGTAGSIFKLAMIRTAPIEIPVLNIHDELIFDVLEDRLDVTIPKLQEAMQSIEFPVPLTCSPRIGDNLADLI